MDEFNPKNFNVLVLTGLKQCGKDYMCAQLTERLSKTSGRRVVRLSFSDELRNITSYIFPWVPKSPCNVEKETPVPHPKNKTKKTPREVWKCVADDTTGICSIQEDVLVDHFERNQLNDTIMSDPDALYIITDLRKVAEDELVEAYGFKKIRIYNPSHLRPEVEDDVEKNVSSFRVDGTVYNDKVSDVCVENFISTVSVLFPHLKDIENA